MLRCDCDLHDMHTCTTFYLRDAVSVRFVSLVAACSYRYSISTAAKPTEAKATGEVGAQFVPRENEDLNYYYYIYICFNMQLLGCRLLELQSSLSYVCSSSRAKQ